LATLLEDLPLASAVDEWAPAGTLAYIELLAQVLEDRVLTSEEAGSLVGLAGLYALTREQVQAAHRGFLLALAHKAIEDGVVTVSERGELLAVAVLLGFPDGTVRTILDEATAAFAAARMLAPKPIPAEWVHGEPLRVGMAVVFTGCDEVERARLEARARAAGLRVTSMVSRRTAVLVTDGRNTATRKAVAASTLGTRTVSPSVFAVIVEHVQPLVPAPREAEVVAIGPVVDAGAVRAWARANGRTIGVRGRIPAEVLASYRAANAS
jgi:DNA polymerase-3 subunit epsilon